MKPSRSGVRLKKITVIGQVTIIGLLMCLCTMSGIKTDDRLHFCQILSQMMDGQSYDGHRAGRGGEQCYGDGNCYGRRL